MADLDKAVVPMGSSSFALSSNDCSSPVAIREALVDDDATNAQRRDSDLGAVSFFSSMAKLALTSSVQRKPGKIHSTLFQRLEGK